MLLHKNASSVMNLKALRYNFNTCDIIKLMEKIKKYLFI